MPDIPETDVGPHDGSSVDPGAALGGTSIPFQAERFGISSHITPSTLAVEVSSHTHPRPRTSVPIQGPEPRHVNIGGTSYTMSHIPSSSTPIPSNEFLTTVIRNIAPSVDRSCSFSLNGLYLEQLSE